MAKGAVQARKKRARKASKEAVRNKLSFTKPKFYKKSSKKLTIKQLEGNF